MIKINLLPIRQIRKRIRIRNEIIAFAVSLSLFIAVLVGIGLSISHKITGLKTQIAQLQQKKASFQPILNKIKKLQAEKLKLEAKLQAIKELKQDSQLTVRVLDEIATRTPSSRLWIKSLKQSRGQLQITGVALDNATIAQYMQQLDGSPFFSGPDLSNSSQFEVGGRKLKSFSLALNVTKPEQQEQPSNMEKKAR